MKYNTTEASAHRVTAAAGYRIFFPDFPKKRTAIGVFFRRSRYNRSKPLFFWVLSQNLLLCQL